MSEEMRVTDAEGAGITWFVRVVMPGEGYGQWLRQEQAFACTNDSGQALVEFYDTRSKNFPPFDAQFVSRYCVSSLLHGFNRNRPTANGLNLDGGDPDWMVGKDAYQKVRTWLYGLVKPEGEREDVQDTDLILAGLRLLQRCKEEGKNLSFLGEIVDVEAISTGEIDELCARINLQ